MEITTNHLSVLIHYHACVEEHPNISASAIQGVITDFITNEILAESESYKEGEASYELTERGRVWLEALKNTPLPIRKWITCYWE